MEKALTVQTFRALGRVVQSDVPLVGLSPAHEFTSHDVRISRAGLGRDHRPDWPPFVFLEARDGMHIHAKGIGHFLIETDGRQIWHDVHPSAPFGDVQYLLTGPLISLAIQQQGGILLHAGAFTIDSSAFALAGAHAAGKSTLTASFADAGFAVLTDDVLPVELEAGAALVKRSVPWIKLHSDSLEALGHSPQKGSPVWSNASKRQISMSTAAIEDVKFSLRAVYVLNPQSAPSCYATVTPLSQSQSAARLLGNAYASDSLIGSRAANAVSSAATLAEIVPVRVISYHRSFENLPAIREAILQDIEELTHA